MDIPIGELFITTTIATIAAMGDKSGRLALVILAAMIAVAWILFQIDDSRLATSPSVPSEIVFLRDGSELVVAASSNASIEPRVFWEQEQNATVGPELFIESVEPISPAVVFAGICCEPAAGRQLLIDTTTGRVEFFPLNLRFPAVSQDRNSLISGGLSIRIDDLGSLLAYENGVGVVPPGDTLRENPEGVVPRPVLLPNNRAAFVDGDVLILTDLAGDVIVESPVTGVQLLRFDALNEVIVALAGAIDDRGTVTGEVLYLLSPDTLRPIRDWPLDRPVSSLDVLDGWLLLGFTDGSLRAAPIDDPLSPTITIASTGAGPASWLD